MPDRKAQEQRLHNVVRSILTRDPFRMQALKFVQSLQLPDSWIGGGFVRDAVWDYSHGYAISAPLNDVDVVWFAQENPSKAQDCKIEGQLLTISDKYNWSVSNQARMHEGNGDAPYLDVAEAMRHWPETATAVAVRTNDAGIIEICAPFGLHDLMHGKIIPTARFVTQKRATFMSRIAEKRWLERYPNLVIITPD